MKVLHCITDLSPDGAQRCLLRLLNALPKEEFQPTVLTLMDGGTLRSQFEKAGIPVVSLGMKRGIPGPTALLKLRQLIRSEAPDVVQGWMYHANFAVSIGAALARSKAPVLWNIRRCLYEQKRDKPLTQLLIKVAVPLSRLTTHVIYCVTKAAEQHEQVGYDPTKRVIIENGFDVSRFEPSEVNRSILRNELGLAPDATLVGIAGRYHPQKDYPAFLRASAKVTLAHPDAHFVLAGRGVSNDNTELTDLIRELEIGNRTHLLGERQDLPVVLSALDIFCSSSDNEGFPNVVGEALASGVPCVVTDAGASRELVEGVGYVVPRMALQELVDALNKMLELPSAERKRLGELGRTRVVGTYALGRMVEAYASLYREVAGSGERGTRE